MTCALCGSALLDDARHYELGCVKGALCGECGEAVAAGVTTAVRKRMLALQRLRSARDRELERERAAAVRLAGELYPRGLRLRS